MWIPVLIAGLFGAWIAEAVHARGPSAEASARAGPSCTISVLLFEPAGVSGQIIDRTTGGRGFSHAAIDSCELGPRGEHLVIDCSPGRGVGRRPLAELGAGRPYVRVILPITAGAEVYGCARARIGQPFTSELVCSQLVWECLPASLRPPKPQGRPVAPNDLAAAWGARPGSPPIYLEV